MLTNYLAANFTSDLQTLTAEQIVKKFGTHVLVDIKTGGKLNMLYRSIIKESSKEEIVKQGSSFALKDVFSLNNEVLTDNTVVNKNTNANLHFHSSGGNTSFSGTFDFKTGTQTVNLGGWASSVNNGELGSAIFIYTNDDTLIPIYELVTDIAKKNALKLAVENYISNSKIKLLSPLHWYNQPTSQDNLYTTWYEIEGKNWTDKGIEGYLYNYNEPGTVPLYRFYHSGINTHFYTTDFSEVGGNSAWKNESVANKLFVYKTQIPGTVPLYRYYDYYKRRHIYTTNYSTFGARMGNIKLERIECYIYPKSI